MLATGVMGKPRVATSPVFSRELMMLVGVQTGQNWDVIARQGQRKGADSPPKLLLIFPSELEPLFA